MGVSLYVSDPTGTAGAFIEDEFSAALTNPTLSSGQFKSAIATASLASIGGTYYTDSSIAAHGAWLVLSVGAHHNPGIGKVELVARLRIAGSHGVVYFSTIAFQVFTTAAV